MKNAAKCKLKKKMLQILKCIRECISLTKIFINPDIAHDNLTEYSNIREQTNFFFYICVFPDLTSTNPEDIKIGF